MLSFYFPYEDNTIQTYNTGGFLSEHAETETDKNCLKIIFPKKSVTKIGLEAVKN
jgi:hypothetical protein